MEQYQLKGEELLYIAANLGAEQLYGVKDVLVGLSEQERKLKIFEVEKNLTAKKYIEEDFDGNIEIKKNIKEVVSICAFFQSCLFMEGIQDGEQDFCYYFIKDDVVYSMKKADEDNYVLTLIEGSTLKSKVHEVVKKELTVDSTISEFLVSLEEMERITTLMKHGATEKGKEELIAAGADEKIANAIVDAIEKKVDFYSFVFMEQSEERVYPHHVMFIQSDVLLKVEYRMQDYDDYMCFYPVDVESIEKSLDAGLERLDIKVVQNVDTFM